MFVLKNCQLKKNRKHKTCKQNITLFNERQKKRLKYLFLRFGA